MLASEDPTGRCRHDRAPLLRLGKARRGGKVSYMLLCTECGFAVSTEELRRVRAGGPALARRPPQYCAFGWAARRARDAEPSEPKDAE